ncbi:MAG: FHA domain-containing protein, partial [Rhodoferax sp.]
MPKMIVSIDEVVIKEVQLTKDKTTLGRRPYNDIVIDNLAVSGEHALLQMVAGEVFLEDLNSTNGTYVNGKAIKRQQLQNGDAIEIGKYRIKFVGDNAPEEFDKTMVVKARPALAVAPAAAVAAAPAAVAPSAPEIVAAAPA